MFEIDYYKDENGKCLYDEYVIKLKKDGCLLEIKKIEHYINLLYSIGNKILYKKDHAKTIVYDLCELRPFPNRIFYYHCKLNNKYVILHLYKKKTNKTLEDEIKKAINEINEYERMIKNEK